MNWAWTVGRVRGIRLDMHVTFPILLVWAAFSGMAATGTLLGGMAEVLFIGALFAFVVLHELGHALTAEQYGVRTRSILLLPIGGVAQMEGMPQEPIGEVAVALAGPAVNLVCAALLYPLAFAAGTLSAAGGLFVMGLFWANLTLALFNLIPAFPMDGGRVMRAILSSKLGRMRATELAARVGQGVALVLGFFGIVGNGMLLLIAFFVWFEAERELQALRMARAYEPVPPDWGGQMFRETDMRYRWEPGENQARRVRILWRE
jgi:Zn-dependent protease